MWLHTPEYYSMEQRHGQSQNLCCPILTRLTCGFIAVLKISWKEKITNEEVLRTMGTGREIVRQFKTRNLQYLGHLIRHNTSQIQLIEGKTEGIRSRGRPRNTWTTDITNTNGMKYCKPKRAAEDMRIWHGLVVNLAQETTLR